MFLPDVISKISISHSNRKTKMAIQSDYQPTEELVSSKKVDSVWKGLTSYISDATSRYSMRSQLMSADKERCLAAFTLHLLSAPLLTQV